MAITVIGEIKLLIAEMEGEIEARKLESPNLSGSSHADNWGRIHALNEIVIRLRDLVLRVS